MNTIKQSESLGRTSIKHPGLLPASYAMNRLLKQVSCRCHTDAQLILQIACHWREIIDVEYITQCQPLKITFSHGHNTLHIQLTNPGLATILQYRQAFLLEKINLIFGYGLINQLKFIVN